MTTNNWQMPSCATSSTEAERLLRAGLPLSPLVHLVPKSRSVLVVDGSKLFQVDADSFDCLVAVQVGNETALAQLLEEFELDGVSSGCEEVPVVPPVRALSLAIAQKCNLGCSYCYASQGDFGGAPKNMPAETALRAVDLLFSDVQRGERVNLAFLGGEPLINRSVLRGATERAEVLAKQRGVDVSFSVTTNGTLLTPDDGEFFESHGFSVTISLDGSQKVHDALRPYKGGAGSYSRILTNVGPLLRYQRRMQVSARVTVTPTNLSLLESLSEFISLGFHSVGFSPLLNAVDGKNEMGGEHWHALLSQMIECGEQFEQCLLAGRRYPFANIITALREIHRGTHRPYPCGAGAAYFGVSADGELAACHRFVGNSRGAMGNVVAGVDRTAQARWLSERHVHNQEPCRSCWARYLCGGGCHHEVIERGRAACDYIRGWLHYCIEAYSRLSVQVPSWFRASHDVERAA